jgi:hypothetical protein
MTKPKKAPRRRTRKNFIMTQAPTKAKIRVRLDERTVITLPHISALKLWKVKYPDAQVLDS